MKILWLVSLVPNIDQFLQVPTFAGCTSLALPRFVFSFAYTYLGIVLGFWLVFCVFRCSNILFFTCLSRLTCDHVLRHNYAGLPFPPFARVLDRRCLLFALTRLYQWFMLALTHAVCSSCPFLFFFTQMYADMMFREFSRPPGDPNHACPRPPGVQLTYYCYYCIP